MEVFEYRNSHDVRGSRLVQYNKDMAELQVKEILKTMRGYTFHTSSSGELLSDQSDRFISPQLSD